MAVNNESSEIIRILNSAFNEFLDEKYAKRDFYPEALRSKIDEITPWVYDLYNNGVYKVSQPISLLMTVWFCLKAGGLYVPEYNRVDEQMKRMFVESSRRWTIWTKSCPNRNILLAIDSPKQIFELIQHRRVLMSLMSVRSNAILECCGVTQISIGG